MINKTKVNQLERRFNQTDKGKGPVVCHKLTYDGRLVDEEGFVMTNDEVKLVADEDKKTNERRGIVVLIRNTDDEEEKPKLKPGSATIPYRSKKNHG